MTIQDVSKKYELTKDTLRYYEKIGLLKDVPRNNNGIRNYDEASCQRIEFIKCMRDAGVEISALIEYFALMEKGKSTVSERKQILINQQKKLMEKQIQIKETLMKLTSKIEIYEDIELGKRKDFSEKRLNGLS